MIFFKDSIHLSYNFNTIKKFKMSSMSSRRNSLSRARVRVRRDSGTKLDYYQKIITKNILCHQVCKKMLIVLLTRNIMV